MKQLIVIISILLNLKVDAQVNIADWRLVPIVHTHNDCEWLGLSGKPKSLIERNRKMIPKKEIFNDSGSVQYSTFNDSGNIINTRITSGPQFYRITSKYLYNKLGKLSEKRTFYNDKLNSKCTYTYDKKLCLSQAKEYDSINKCIYQAIYKYDTSKLFLKEEISWNKDTVSTHYEYDANGYLVNIMFSYSDKKENYRHNYSYNNMGKIIESKIFRREGLSDSYQNEYDSAGNLIEYKSQRYVDGSLYSKKNYLFDCKNNFIFEQYFKSPSNDISTYINVYVYDSHGNWIKKTMYLNGTLREITEREIVYY